MFEKSDKILYGFDLGCGVWVITLNLTMSLLFSANYFPFEIKLVFYLNKLESSFPKDALYQVKLNEVVMENF